MWLLVIGCFLLFGGAVVVGQPNQGIDYAYQINPDAARLNAHTSAPRLCQVFWTPNNYSVITCLPTYGFNDTAGALGQVFVPDTITFPLPYCAIANVLTFSITPPECNAPFIYGAESILVNNPSSTVNGASDSQITGLFVPALDSGYPFPWSGTFQWRRPAACASINPTFNLTIGIGVLANFSDQSPIEYCDSYSGECLSLVAYGLACGNTGIRLPTSARLNPNPYFSPICSVYVDCAHTANVSICEQLMGDAITPANQHVNSFVYQLRVDGLGPGLLIDAVVNFFYPDNTNARIELFPGFNNIYYFASNGSVPAAVSVCYYTSTCTPVFTWNEVALGYLSPCNCSFNILCNSSNYLITDSLMRSQIPNFNQFVAFVPSPICAIAFQPINNGSFAVEDTPFTLQSLSSGGGGILNYAWQLSNVPPSGGIIDDPSAITTQATVFAPQLVTIVHTVYVLNGLSATCNITVPIVPIAPTACINPSTLFNSIIGITIPLDGGCSTTPDNGLLTYNWTILSQTYPYTGGSLIGSPVGKTIGFQCTLVGTYIIGLVVNNTFEIDSATSIIQCVTPPPPITPGTAPVEQNLPPLICQTPAPPLPPSFLVPPTTPVTPLGPIPVTPAFLPTAPTTPPGTTPAVDTSGIVTVFVVILLIIVLFAAFCLSRIFSGPSVTQRAIVTDVAKNV